MKELTTIIKEYIKENNNNRITASLLQDILVKMVHQPNELIGDINQIKTNNKTLVASINELLEYLDLKSGIPLGTIQQYAGQQLPIGWASCEGQSLLKTNYPELWQILQTQDPTNNLRFLLPDLRGRFLVGHDTAKDDYKTVGQKGGLDTVTLTVNQMPGHTHHYDALIYDGSNWTDLRVSDELARRVGESNRETTANGGNQAHENRPPYYVIKYIIFLGQKKETN